MAASVGRPTTQEHVAQPGEKPLGLACYAAYLGFAALLLWLQLFSATFDACVRSSWHVTGALWASVGVFSLVGAVMALCGAGVRAVRAVRLLDVAASACLVGAVAGCTVSPALGSPMAVAVLGVVGLAASWLLLRWGSLLARLDLAAATRVVAANAAVYFVAKVFAGALEREGVSAFAALLVVLVPVALVGLWRASAVPVRRGYAFYTKDSLRDLAGIFGFMALFSVALVLLDMLTAGIERGLLGYLAAAVVFMAVGVWVFVLKRSLDFFTDVRTLLLVTACGATLCVAALGVTRQCSAGVVLGIRELTRFYLFLLQADIARHAAMSPAVTFGLGWACCGLPRIGLFWLSEEALGSIAPAEGGYKAAVLVMLLPILLAIMAYSLIKMPPGLRPPFSPMKPPDDASPNVADARDAHAKLAQDWGLTLREAQVLEYLCAGRSRGYIAETLYISENTVKFHTKNIYRKLGVSSKQELLDRADGVLGRVEHVD